MQTIQKSRDEMISVTFWLLEDKWQFTNFEQKYKKSERFLILEEDIKRRHGSIKNLTMFYDLQKKTKIDYNFKSDIHQVFNDLMEKQGKKEVVIYYCYDNGYEWPLLSF